MKFIFHPKQNSATLCEAQKVLTDLVEDRTVSQTLKNILTGEPVSLEAVKILCASMRTVFRTLDDTYSPNGMLGNLPIADARIEQALVISRAEGELSEWAHNLEALAERVNS